MACLQGSVRCAGRCRLFLRLCTCSRSRLAFSEENGKDLFGLFAEHQALFDRRLLSPPLQMQEVPDRGSTSMSTPLLYVHVPCLTLLQSGSDSQ